MVVKECDIGGELAFLDMGHRKTTRQSKLIMVPKSQGRNHKKSLLMNASYLTGRRSLQF